MKCRFCQHELTYEFIDLGLAPPSNSFLDQNDLSTPELYLPLRLMVCDNCFLVQLVEDEEPAALFNSDYVYFSSYSKTWLKHAKDYVEMITRHLELSGHSYVIEIASNDGYLLQYFLEKGIPCLGIEPTHSTASVATKKGIPVLEEFFGTDIASGLALKGRQADLIIGNNVLAHVPDINDFVKGLKILLHPEGVITMEFPHLVQLVEGNQFDTIYHEHFSYLSFHSVQRIFLENGLKIFDVETLHTHGGSLRIYACHHENNRDISEFVIALNQEELNLGINRIDYYMGLQEKAETIKRDLLAFLIEKKENRKKVAGYGAAAKGNTLFNFCGVGKDLVPFVVDASPHKQGKLLPGSHIPVVSEQHLMDNRPDFILIIPWNIETEIRQQLDYCSQWDAKFFIAVPELQLLN
jgi:SAM-dependent methyltransferase